MQYSREFHGLPARLLLLMMMICSGSLQEKSVDLPSLVSRMIHMRMRTFVPNTRMLYESEALTSLAQQKADNCDTSPVNEGQYGYIYMEFDSTSSINRDTWTKTENYRNLYNGLSRDQDSPLCHNSDQTSQICKDIAVVFNPDVSRYGCAYNEQCVTSLDKKLVVCVFNNRTDIATLNEKQILVRRDAQDHCDKEETRPCPEGWSCKHEGQARFCESIERIPLGSSYGLALKSSIGEMNMDKVIPSAATRSRPTCLLILMHVLLLAYCLW